MFCIFECQQRPCDWYAHAVRSFFKLGTFYTVSLILRCTLAGTNQSSGGYYQRMHQYFLENLGAHSTRSHKAVQHRWMAIQKAVNRFSGFFSTVQRLDESGKTEENQVNVLTM